MDLFFREYGEGRPLLILHGLFGQSDNWNTLAKHFATQGLRVYTADLRNHGLSPHSDQFSYDDMADDLHTFIRTHQLKDAIVMGHSMGGKAALFLEYKYPGLVKDFIIADMAARAYPPHHQKVLAALHAIKLDTITTRKEAEAIMAMYLDDFGTRQFLLKNIYWKGDVMDWRFNLPVITANYEKITGPVPAFVSMASACIIRGAKSDYVSDHDLIDFDSRFPDHKVVTIEGAGHWVHADKPMEFGSAVLDFIKGSTH
jgi:pimeloyl-ACP methyl ester carboxylesterase